MINLPVIHEGRFVKLNNFTLEDVINWKNLDEEKKQAFKDLGWDKEDLSERVTVISEWIESHLPTLTLKILIESSSKETLQVLIENCKCEENLWELYGKDSDDINLDLAKCKTYIRGIVCDINVLKEMMTLKDDKDFYKKAVVNKLINVRNALGFSKGLTHDGLSMGLVRYGFKAYQECFTREVIESKIQETLDCIEKYNYPNLVSRIFEKTNGQFPLVSIMKYQKDPVEFESELLAERSKRRRSNVYWKKFLNNVLNPLREKANINVREEAIELLQASKESNISPAIIENCLFGKGFVYQEDWKELVKLVLEIQKERPDLFEEIEKVFKALRGKTDITESYCREELATLDGTFTALKRKSYLLTRESFISYLKGCVSSWNEINFFDPIELDESKLIRNDRIDTKYIEPMIMQIDIFLNDIRRQIEEENRKKVNEILK